MRHAENCEVEKSHSYCIVIYVGIADQVKPDN